MKTILFRDKTAALDLITVPAKGFWDNTVPAKHMVRGDTIFITPTRSNYKTHEEWLNAPAIWAFAGENDSVKLTKEADTWPSGKGNYVHRHELSSSLQVLVRDLEWVDKEAFEELLKWRQGAVRYIHSESSF